MQRSQPSYCREAYSDCDRRLCYSRNGHEILIIQPMALQDLASICGWKQQYGNYHEIAALAAIQQPALIVFVGDHRQTPGGLSKGRAAAANRQKLLHRPLRLRALNRSGDYLPPARLAKLIALLWPDASQDNDSDVACLLNVGQAPHTGVWTAATTTQHLPTSWHASSVRKRSVISMLLAAWSLQYWRSCW